jgi:hypothetical protein
MAEDSFMEAAGTAEAMAITAAGVVWRDGVLPAVAATVEAQPAEAASKVAAAVSTEVAVVVRVAAVVVDIGKRRNCFLMNLYNNAKASQSGGFFIFSAQKR